ncbi:MAG: hypothetical protein OXI57_06865 [Rhodospirillales bacterium]|nr:hypothetical protein [Rhodospirillales bacterium]
MLLVHHARKSDATRPGQALRGDSELHAWEASNLYLRRRDRQTLMTVEHHAARGLDDIEIELKEDGEEPTFRLRQPPSAGQGASARTPRRPHPQGARGRQGAAFPTPDPRTRRNPPQDWRRRPEKRVQKGRIERNAEGHYSVVAGATDKAASTDAVDVSRRPQVPRFPNPGSANA